MSIMNTMETLPFRLEDLEPKDTVFYLSVIKTADNQPAPLTLGRWSLRVRNWAVNKFGYDELQKIFSGKRIESIAEIAWYMLKEKDRFPVQDGMTPQEVFFDSVVTIQDQLNLITALLGAVGMGEPEIKKLVDAQAAQGNPVPNATSPNQ